jgi:hypothetical protein
VLAVFAGSPAKAAAELPREGALAGKAAVRGHLGQQLVGVNQGMRRHTHPQAPQILLRREMEAAVELAFKRPHRHVRQAGQLLIRYGCVVVIPQIEENRAQLNPQEDALAGRVQSPGDAGSPDDGSSANRSS